MHGYQPCDLFEGSRQLECRNRTGNAQFPKPVLYLLSQFHRLGAHRPLGTHRAMGSVSAPGGIREPAPSERRTPPNPRSDEAFASALAAPETRRGAIQMFRQAIKKALFDNRPGLSSLEGRKRRLPGTTSRKVNAPWFRPRTHAHRRSRWTATVATHSANGRREDALLLPESMNSRSPKSACPDGRRASIGAAHGLSTLTHLPFLPFFSCHWSFYTSCC